MEGEGGWKGGSLCEIEAFWSCIEGLKGRPWEGRGDVDVLPSYLLLGGGTSV